MRWNGFARSLAFAAAAALGVVPYLIVAGPSFGGALPLYLAAAGALYAAGLSGSPRRRLGAALVSSGIGVGAWIAASSLAEVAIGAALALAIARSGLLYRARPARAFVLELALCGGGLLFARFLAGPGLGGIALAVWGFFLVQSFFFLIPGSRPRRAAPGVDPFERASSRLHALFEEGAA